jgi:uncharacterized membrane protein YhaH (DUF805 family)
MKWVLVCLRKYGDFTGRAGIVECFTFLLFVVFCMALALGLDLIMGWRQENIVDWVSWYPTFEITRLALALPFFAVTARRLHDVHRSGWLTLLWFVPIVGWVYLLLQLAQPGEEVANPDGPPVEGAQPQSTVQSA